MVSTEVGWGSFEEYKGEAKNLALGKQQVPATPLVLVLAQTTPSRPGSH